MIAFEGYRNSRLWNVKQAASPIILSLGVLAEIVASLEDPTSRLIRRVAREAARDRVSRS